MDDIKKKIPKDAFTFYLKLYCKRKAKSKSKEAIKSWISLNNPEKKIILLKYNEYLNNVKKKVADYLKNAEPYMKLKATNMHLGKTPNLENQEIDTSLEINQSKCTVNSESILKDVNERMLSDESFNQSKLHTNVENQNISANITSSNIMLSQFSRSAEAPPMDVSEVSIPEPAAPKVLNGEDLFLMLNERRGDELTWKSLTKSQKGKYYRAVLNIKKKYLKDYRKYLEHLPPEKLHNYYMNIMGSVEV